MTINETAVTSSDPTSADGADLTGSAALSAATYTDAGWSTDVWNLADDILPYIAAFGTTYGPVNPDAYAYLSADGNQTAPTGLSAIAPTPTAARTADHGRHAGNGIPCVR